MGDCCHMSSISSPPPSYSSSPRRRALSTSDSSHTECSPSRRKCLSELKSKYLLHDYENVHSSPGRPCEQLPTTYIANSTPPVDSGPKCHRPSVYVIDDRNNVVGEMKQEDLMEVLRVERVRKSWTDGAPNLHDRYLQEINAVRERIGRYDERREANGGDRGGGTGRDFQAMKQRMEAVVAMARRENGDRGTVHLGGGGRKLGVKTTVRRSGSGSARMRRVRATPRAAPAPLFTESDYSGSDDDSEPDEEEANPADEESENLSEGNEIEVVAAKISQPEAGDAHTWPIRPSLFPHIPPYIKFTGHECDQATVLPAGGKRMFKWKLSTITPVLVRKTLTNSGFCLVRKSNQWMGTWGKHMKSPMFKTLKDNQKLNHFPGTFQLGRKDRLWRNFQRLINKHGYKEFGFLPQTFVLPQELKILKQNWEYKNGSGGETWIIKPPASARGVGIKVINRWSQLPKKLSLVVQKYITNPYLIDGSKFDLRLYVLVTSFNPLRIYLYPEGLARFASAKYSQDAKDLKDVYMHLTNYSINKLSSQYTANEDANLCQGHKWTLTKLFEYLREKRGVVTETLWQNLRELVVKTIITADSPINNLCDENMLNGYNCYELFGIDVLLDANLKPWLLEVNISPSLHSTSPLDAHVKGPLVQMLFDLAQFHLPARVAQITKGGPEVFEPKLYSGALTKKERQKHASFSLFESRDDYLEDILNDLTGDDVRRLTRAEDEFVAKGRFERVFPTADTHRYFNFMERRYYNRLFDAWENKYESRRDEGVEVLRRLCHDKKHLKVAPKSSVAKSLPSTIPGTIANLLQPSKEGQSHPAQPLSHVTIVEGVDGLVVQRN